MFLALALRADHDLPATSVTVAWGCYWADVPPVLRIRSGETARVHTFIISILTRLEGAGVSPAHPL